MQPTHRASTEKRMVAGIAAAMLVALGWSVGVLTAGSRSDETQANKEQPFWSNDLSASNLAVVELQRSGLTAWGQSNATGP